jgi:hypothetical protein
MQEIFSSEKWPEWLWDPPGLIFDGHHLKSTQNVCGVYLASYSMDTEVFLGSKAAGK